MWSLVTTAPLVVGVWAYNEEDLEARLSKLLATSRNLGLQNLSRLADGIAATSHYGSERLYDYFASHWAYHLGEEGREGLRVLEELATEYDLVRGGRFAGTRVHV
jgi:predicted solute-binding protein